MYFILAKNLDNNTLIICDEHGEQRRNINKEEYTKIEQKICKFDKSKLALIHNGKLIKNSVTVIGKYYFGKARNIKYLVCDGTLNKKSLTKEEILNSYNSIEYSNIKVCSNGSIRLIHGSIPFLNNLKTLRGNDTVIKIGNIDSGTPGSIGVGKKLLGKRIKDNKIGCIKFELFPGSYDINNEVLAYKLGSILNFDIVEATFENYNNKRCVISVYNYDTSIENIRSLKTEVGTDNFHSKFNKNWFMQNKSENAWNKFIQMIMLDLIMHQTDRHISNIAFKDKDLYSLYDNGRALFFDEFDEAIENIDLNIRGSIVESFHTNEHGYGWMFLEDIVGYSAYRHLINHKLEHRDFIKIVDEAYGDKDKQRNSWVAEYMYKVYLIIIRQEKRWKQ